MLFVDDQVALSFSFSFFSFFSRFSIDGDGDRWRWKGLKWMMPCPKRDGRKNYIHTCTCTCTCQSCSQRTNSIPTFHVIIIIQGCVNEVMIEFFRSHLLLVGIPVYIDLTCFIHHHYHSPINGVPQVGMNTFDTNLPTVVWSYYYLQQVPYLIYIPYLTLPHTTYLTDLGKVTGSFNSSSIKEKPHDRQQSKHMIRYLPSRSKNSLQCSPLLIF